MPISRLTLVGLFTAAGVPATAAGLVETAPVIEPTAPVIAAPQEYDWTGPSVGLQFGYADVEGDLDGLDADLEGDGAIGGITVNYDYDFGRFVAGAVLDYDFADLEVGDDALTVEGVFRLGGRVGITSNRNWYYLTGGYARAITEDDDDVLDFGDGDGYFVGLGYEVFLTQNITAGAEALYHEFTEFDEDDLEAEATTVQLSVNYRF